MIVVVPAGYGASSAWPSPRSAATVTLLPVVVGVPNSCTVTVAVQELSAFFVTVAGQLIVGAAEPVTVTTKWQTPPLSAELTVTVVCPTGKNVPDAGEVDNAPHSPDASAEPKVTIAPDTPLCVVLAVRVM